ncbi:MAG TPA: coenzyme F420-0:L-glutamate ligase [Nitrososphaerales archaeon]|nr:coenzyme F420-0:L-glutamate ligase [Nitrososphaerales archaeon]
MAESQSLSIIPVAARVRFEPFDLEAEVWLAIEKTGAGLHDGDIVVVSSKYAAVSEGRMMDLSKIKVDQKARLLAEKYALEPGLAQLVLDESDSILGGIPGFVLSLVSGTLAPNAGVDRSNVPKGYVVQYPKDPFRTAGVLREFLLEKIKATGEIPDKLGVILSDSRVTPTRLGTVGVAIAYAGMKPTIDMRGTPDLLGNKLVVTLRAVADQLVSAAELVMGESNEGRPIVIIKGFEEAFSEAKSDFEKRATIDTEHCLILRSLKNPP